MAYPEPIPTLKGKDAKNFDERLKEFSLTDEQKSQYRLAKKKYS